MKLFSLFKKKPLSIVPPTVIAAGIISALEEISDKRPNQARVILRNMWLDIAPFLIPIIDENPTAKYVPSILALEAYFGHSGDWKKMRAAMSTNGRFLPKELEERMADNIRKEFLAAAEKTK